MPGELQASKPGSGPGRNGEGQGEYDEPEPEICALQAERERAGWKNEKGSADNRLLLFVFDLSLKIPDAGAARRKEQKWGKCISDHPLRSIR